MLAAVSDAQLHRDHPAVAAKLARLQEYARTLYLSSLDLIHRLDVARREQRRAASDLANHEAYERGERGEYAERSTLQRVESLLHGGSRNRPQKPDRPDPARHAMLAAEVEHAMAKVAALTAASETTAARAAAARTLAARCRRRLGLPEVEL